MTQVQARSLLVLGWLLWPLLIAGPSGLSMPTAAAQRAPSPLQEPLALYTLLNQPGPAWLVGVDLADANLEGTDLQGANLTEANLRGATLVYADLRNATLRLANLQTAQAAQATFDGADLALADLSAARLAAASLVEAKLEGAALREAQLAAARLDRARLTQADLRAASLRGASLQETDLTLADLRRADLSGANLTGAILANANLEGANLQGTVLAEITYDAQTRWPAGFDPTHPERAPGAPLAPSRGPRPLHLELALLPALVAPFNQLAQPGDVARVDHLADLSLLDQVQGSQRMVVFKSAALAEQLVPRFAGHFDLLGYNLEHGPLNPIIEQQDPAAAVQRLRALADHHGLGLVIGPDHDFALSHGVALAPYADRFILQIQRVQAQPEVARDFVLTTASSLRQANPRIEIAVQLRAEGDPDALAALIRSLAGQIDGVAILPNPQAPGEATTLWTSLRREEGGAVQTLPGPAMTWMDMGRPLLLGLAVQAAVLFGLAAALLLIFRFWPTRARP